MPIGFDPERTRCSVCGQRRRIWGNQIGQRMLGCATCNVGEIKKFLAHPSDKPQITADDKRFLAELGIGW